MRPTVAVVRCPDYTEKSVYSSIKRAIELLGGMDRFFSDGQRILLKPNLCLPEPPERAITTHPEIVRQLARILKELNCQITVGDNPVGMVDTMRLDHIWKTTGMERVAQELGLTRSYLFDDLQRYVCNINGSEQEFYLSSELFGFDGIINLPKFKTHTLMTFTGAVKNLFGLLPGNTKRILHCNLPEHDGFAQLLLNLHHTVRPCLSITDAVAALEGDGPGSGGRRRDMHLLLASDNCIALDILSSRLMNIHPSEVPVNRVAVDMGYYPFDYYDMDIVGEDIDRCIDEDFVLPNTRYYNRNVVKKIFTFAKTGVRIDPGSCRLCGLCKENCPTNAIEEQSGYMQIIGPKCISCMTCHEICPHEAVRIERPEFYGQLTGLKEKKLRHVSRSGLFDMLAGMSEQYPDKPALITRKCSYTYKELVDYTNTAADYLKTLALGKNEPVGLAYRNSPEFVALLFACAKLSIPAFLFGADLKPSELVYHVRHGGVGKIMACAEMTPVMLECGFDKKHDDNGAFSCWVSPCKGASTLRDGDLFCQLTSGTRGLAKASVRTEDAILNELVGTVKAMDFTHDDSFMTLTPIHHSYGLVAGTLLPLTIGCGLFLFDEFIPVDVLNEINVQKTTVLLAVPYMYHMFLQVMDNRGKFESSGMLNTTSLRCCLSAGAPLPQRTAEEYAVRFGRKITQDYGSTETGVICINYPPSADGRSVGRAVGDGEVRAFGPDGRMLPPDEPGELRVRSRSTARAYLYPEKLNQTAFCDGWFSTGDIGYTDSDGYVYVSGKNKNIINVAGRKVDPAEVEETIKAMDGVLDVAVVGIDAGASGESPKAFVVTARPMDAREVILHCRRHISAFKAPKYVEFVKEIPRSRTGKVLAKYLVERGDKNDRV